MKDILKLKEKLDLIQNRWQQESEENTAHIEDANRRIAIAKEELQSAEDAAEYAHAQKAIDTAQTDLNFYNLQRSRFKHYFDDKEYADAKHIIDAERSKLINECSEEIKRDYVALLDKIYKYDENTSEIRKLQTMLNKLAGKAPATNNNDSISKLSPVEGFDRRYDCFADFCDYVQRRKNTANQRKAAGGN